MSHSRAIKGVRRAVLAALGITIMGIGSAWAGPVSVWGFDMTSKWDTALTVFSSGNGPTTNDDTTLAWGNSSHPNQSSLVIGPNNATGTVNTDGAFADSGIIVTHNNYVISLSSHILTSAALFNTITLTPVTPPGASQAPISFEFGINFDETPNTAPCAVTSSPIPCNDIFVISKDSLNQTFTYDGYNYFLSLFPESAAGGINFLSDAVCAAAGAASGCFGFTTEENTSNPLRFGLTITSSPIGVPEPATLGMVGLGLLTIVGLAIRRRKLSVKTS